MELSLLAFLCLISGDVALRCRRLHPLKFFLRLLQPFEQQLLLRGQVPGILLLQLGDLLGAWLLLLLLPELRVQIVLASAVHESLHVRLDERPVDDIDHSRSRFFILHKKHVYDFLELIAVVAFDGLLLVLYDLEHETEEVLGVESVLQRTQLVENAAKGPDV